MSLESDQLGIFDLLPFAPSSSEVIDSLSPPATRSRS